MPKKSKIMLIRIVVTSIIFFPMLIAEHKGLLEGVPVWGCVLMFLIPYIIIGYDIVLKALKNIKKGNMFDENFLMMLATLGAFGVQEFSESVAVMLFYQVGELFQSIAVGKSRQAISALMDIAPESANLETEDGIEVVDPDEVEVGSIIIIKAGEKVPLDGVVLEGNSMVDTKALTGESVPRSVKPGEDIYSGCINGSGTLRVRTTKEYDDSTVAKILELVEEAGDRKANVENFITRFARYYTPCVTIGAILLAVLGPVISGQSVSVWILRACTFLVVSCPCALVISVPMGFFGGIGAASSHGILVKGSNYLELMSRVDTIVFDKTGTLTKGEFRVCQVSVENGFSQDEVLGLAKAVEQFSNHPIAQSILACEGECPEAEASEEISGFGIKAVVNGRIVLCGNSGLMERNGIQFTENENPGTVVYVAADNVFAGSILISDTIKEGAKEALYQIKKSGVKKLVMLTGDRPQAATAVAKELAIDVCHDSLLPGDKVAKVEELLETKTGKSCVAFVGDGINDAPVLRRSDVGIAMGSMGSDAAIEAADIVLMDDSLKKIALAAYISRRTLNIVRQNIVFALTVKFAVLLLSAIGIANMWAAVFADVGVAVIAILNSMRALSIGQKAFI